MSDSADKDDELQRDFDRLRELLDSADPDVRGMAAVGLQNVADPRATDLLVKLLSDSDPRVVCAAARSLGERADTTATPALVELIGSGNPEEKCSALAAIALIRDPRAFSAVVVQLFDTDDEVRRNAAGAIGSLGDVRALEPLYSLLTDASPWVRGNAVISIGALAQPSSVPQLEQMLATEEDPKVRGNLLMSLGNCDARQASRIIQALADDAEDQAVRVSAAVALAAMAVGECLPSPEVTSNALADVYTANNADDELRATAIWALGRMAPTPRVTRTLETALDDSYRWAVLYAIEGLALQKDTSSLERLQEFAAANQDDEEIQRQVQVAQTSIQQADDKPSSAPPA